MKQDLHTITGTTKADWETLTGGATHTTIGSNQWVFKYGGTIPWNIQSECQLFNLLTGEAQIIQDPEFGEGLLMQKIGTEVLDRKDALKKLPLLLHKLHQTEPPHTTPIKSPLDNALEKINMRLPNLADGPEKEWVQTEAENLHQYAEDLKGQTLTHNDPHLENVRVNTDGNYKLLDFEWTSAGSIPEQDIAMLLYSGIYRKDTTFPGYNPAELYPENLNKELIEICLLLKALTGISYRLTYSTVEHTRELAALFLNKEYPYSALTKSTLQKLQ